MAKKLIRHSGSSQATLPKQRNLVELPFDGRHAVQSDWFSGTVPTSRHNSGTAEKFYRGLDTISPSDSREGRKSGPRVNLDGYRPSILNFVDDPKNLPKMFFLEKTPQRTAPEEDTYALALEHSRLPCTRLKDASNCFDLLFESLSPNIRQHSANGNWQHHKKIPSSHVLPGPSTIRPFRQRQNDGPKRVPSNSVSGSIFVRLTRLT